MLKLKTVSLLKHRSDLSILPEDKLLINTINAHSYNTALKDAEFAEALAPVTSFTLGRSSRLRTDS